MLYPRVSLGVRFTTRDCFVFAINALLQLAQRGPASRSCRRHPRETNGQRPPNLTQKRICVVCLHLFDGGPGCRLPPACETTLPHLDCKNRDFFDPRSLGDRVAHTVNSSDAFETPPTCVGAPLGNPIVGDRIFQIANG